MLVVPILFKVKNFSVDLFCEFSLEFIQEKTESSNPYLWMGTTKLNFKEIKPNEEFSISINACFFSPGIYNLSSFELKYNSQKSKSSELIRFNEFQYFINILE
jgi:hypothetical protein